MTPAPLHFRGERLMLDPSGCVWWPARRMLIVADLHLEKGTASARAGRLLPPYDTAQTLDRLALVCRRYDPAILVALGDSFHDRDAAARMRAPDRARLIHIAAPRDMLWITGNHDPEPPADLPGRSADSLLHDGFVLRHIPGEDPDEKPEIAGHFHPKARVVVRGQAIARPCFITSDTRLILPAFGAYTGGLDVTDPAIALLYPKGGRLFLLGRDRLYSFPAQIPRKGRRMTTAASTLP